MKTGEPESDHELRHIIKSPLYWLLRLRGAGAPLVEKIIPLDYAPAASSRGMYCGGVKEGVRARLDAALARASAAPLILLLDDVAEPGRVVVTGHLLDLLPARRRVARARVVRGRRVLRLLLVAASASGLIYLGLGPWSLEVFCFAGR